MSLDFLIASLSKTIGPPKTQGERGKDAMMTMGNTPSPIKPDQAHSQGVKCGQCGHHHGPGKICSFNKGIEGLFKAVDDGAKAINTNTGIKGHSGGNPYQLPAGSPEGTGGQFTTADLAGSVTTGKGEGAKPGPQAKTPTAGQGEGSNLDSIISENQKRSDDRTLKPKTPAEEAMSPGSIRSILPGADEAAKQAVGDSMKRRAAKDYYQGSRKAAAEGMKRVRSKGKDFSKQRVVQGEIQREFNRAEKNGVPFGDAAAHIADRRPDLAEYLQKEQTGDVTKVGKPQSSTPPQETSAGFDEIAEEGFEEIGKEPKSNLGGVNIDELMPGINAGIKEDAAHPTRNINQRDLDVASDAAYEGARDAGQSEHEASRAAGDASDKWAEQHHEKTRVVQGRVDTGILDAPTKIGARPLKGNQESTRVLSDQSPISDDEIDAVMDQSRSEYDARQNATQAGSPQAANRQAVKDKDTQMWNTAQEAHGNQAKDLAVWRAQRAGGDARAQNMAGVNAFAESQQAHAEAQNRGMTPDQVAGNEKQLSEMYEARTVGFGREARGPLDTPATQREVGGVMPSAENKFAQDDTLAAIEGGESPTNFDDILRDANDVDGNMGEVTDDQIMSEGSLIPPPIPGQQQALSPEDISNRGIIQQQEDLGLRFTDSGIPQTEPTQEDMGEVTGDQIVSEGSLTPPPIPGQQADTMPADADMVVSQQPESESQPVGVPSPQMLPATTPSQPRQQQPVQQGQRKMAQGSNRGIPFSQMYGAGSAIGAGMGTPGGMVGPTGAFAAQRAHQLLNPSLRPEIAPAMTPGAATKSLLMLFGLR